MSQASSCWYLFILEVSCPESLCSKNAESGHFALVVILSFCFYFYSSAFLTFLLSMPSAFVVWMILFVTFRNTDSLHSVQLSRARFSLQDYSLRNCSNDGFQRILPYAFDHSLTLRFSESHHQVPDLRIFPLTH